MILNVFCLKTLFLNEILKTFSRLVKATLDAQHDDLGIGLQLFYNTQIFLILFSLLGLATAFLFLRVLTPGYAELCIAEKI